jgi:hypothetical protein
LLFISGGEQYLNLAIVSGADYIVRGYCQNTLIR